MDYRRNYYFDGKNILSDNYEDKNLKKFDQTYDELNAGEVFRKNNQSSQSLNNTNYVPNVTSSNNLNNLNNLNNVDNSNNNMSYTNLQNFMMSGDHPDNFELNAGEMNNTNYMSNTNFMSNTNNNFNSQSENNFYKSADQNTLISKELISTLKDHYYKTKGYIENKIDILMEFILEYKNFNKRGLKVPTKLHPFLAFSNEDIYYSLYHYDNQSKILSSNNTKTQNFTTNKFKSKFTKETLKRLYPKLKTDEEIQKLKSQENRPEFFDKFATRLIIEYSKFYKEYTNEENKLYDFWLGLTTEDKEKLCLIWESGEKNLEDNLIKYFSDEKIIQRLSKIFQKVCNYECFHPRPLHDYWMKQILIEDKFIRGLYKYSDESLYQILEENYNKRMNEEKQYEDERLKQTKIEENLNKNKNKVDKTQYEKIKKKFAELAKPKDKFKTGRAMIRLKKQFQYDKIVKKMIKYEFETNKLFRFPEEYALYDTQNMRKTLFKNSLEKKIPKEKENVIRELITKTREDDISKKRGEDYQLENILKEDNLLEKYLRQMCIKYYNLTMTRLNTNSNMPINHFLSEIYQFMLKNHLKSTRRRFPKMKNYGAKKKLRFTNYPHQLKHYFFNMYRRLGINEDNKFVFANNDNMPFWAPSLSNNCKIHYNNCPIYCKNNTHNEVISTQRTKNFNVLYNLENEKLDLDERLHLWKRKDKDLYDLKSQIFMCFSEAEHCTFEPKINKKEDDFKNLTNEEIVEKRISNKVWVGKMGGNFSTRFPLVYKEGVIKRVQKKFIEGKFSEVLKELGDAFELDPIRAHFNPKFKILYEKRLQLENKKRIEMNENNDKNEKNKNDIQALINAHHDKDKKVPEKDNFDNPKNKQLCEEVYYMLKSIDDYRNGKKKEMKKIKEEIKIVEETKKELKDGKSLENTNNLNKSSIHQLHHTNYIKDRYFKFFKTLMCPLKNECPLDIRPRWPHSDLKANTPFGLGCPYAHHISEIKFEQEVKEKIKMKKSVLKELEKEDDPYIAIEWVPTGPIISCIGCGKTFTDKSNHKSRGERVGAAGGPKGLCGFCKYHQKNEIVLKRDMSLAEITNKEILKKINYGDKRIEDFDQDYIAKFGSLKKAIVLYSFKRYTDSYNIMERLKSLVESEQKSNEERFVSLDKKWRAKLQISEEIHKDILNYKITQEVLDYFNIKIQLSTLLVYIDKMNKGNGFSIYNRHSYLNTQILQFHQNVDKTLNKYKTDYKMLKGKLNEINLWSEKKDKLKNEDPKLYDKFYKKYRAGMCPNIVNGNKCKESYRDCKFAHNSNQLNLTLVDKQKKLIRITMKETQKKMKTSNTLVPWKNPREGFYEKGLQFDKTMVLNQTDVKKLRSRSAKKDKSVDIRKMRINYHEI